MASEKGDDESAQLRYLKEKERPVTPKIALSPLPESDDPLRKLPDPKLPEGHPYYGMKGKTVEHIS